VLAPASGTVAEVLVAEGDVLEATGVLMRIDD
jgi:biotin carboxyl carrier protein